MEGGSRVERGTWGARETPLLAQVPLQLLRFPGLLLPVVATAALLAAVASSSGLFLSSAADRAVEIELGSNRGATGMTIAMYGPVAPTFLRPRSTALQQAVARIPDVRSPRVTISRAPVRVSAGTGGTVPAQIVARSG